ncbi:MAG: tetratricopeptide repeat protein [Myxococcales bacterium]|nr:tetratricopeptide repeat protein [Myxococcales bacterium]
MRAWAKAAGVLLLAVAAYFPALGAGFVFDDALLLTDNRLIRESGGLFDIWFSTQPKDYLPLTHTSFWLEWRLWGEWAAGYHLSNVLLHGLSAVLLGLLLERLSVRGAFFAAALFAVHPVAASSVAWVSERKNALSGLLFLVALWAFLRFERSGKRAAYLGSLGLFLLSLLCKASAVMMPPLLLLLAFWQRGKVSWRDLLRSAPFFALSAGAGAVTIWFQLHRAISYDSGPPEGALERLAAAGWSIWFYLGKAFVPLGLSLIYPRWEVEGRSLLHHLPWMAYLAGLAFLWAKRKSFGRPLLVGLGHHGLFLLPVLGFLEMYWRRFSFVADHLQYLSLMGPVALAGGAGAFAFERAGKLGRGALLAFGALCLGVLSALTFSEAQSFRDEETLWRTTVERNPKAWVAHYNLGASLVAKGRKAEAEACFRQTLRLHPGYSEAHNNLGSILSEMGELPGALEHFARAVKSQPRNLAARRNLAVHLARSGRTEESLGEFGSLLRDAPDDAVALHDFGATLAGMGRLEEAIDRLSRAVELQPEASWREGLGTLLEARGRRSEAAREYREALRVDPSLTRAREGLSRLEGQ